MQTTVYEYDARIAAIHKLRVNLKSLVAESRFIRQEERRCGTAYRNTLREHRIKAVREESRYTHLALSFVRGRKYSDVEQKAFKAVDAARLAKKVEGKWRAGKGVTEWLAAQ